MGYYVQNRISHQKTAEERRKLIKKQKGVILIARGNFFCSKTFFFVNKKKKIKFDISRESATWLNILFQKMWPKMSKSISDHVKEKFFYISNPMEIKIYNEFFFLKGKTTIRSYH